LESIDELEAIKQQFEKLKGEIVTGRETLTEKEGILNETNQQVESLTTVKQGLEETLDQKTLKITELERELVSMKQTLVQGLKETKEFKEHYHHAATERTAMVQKNISMQQQLQKQKEELQKREIEFQRLENKMKETEGSVHSEQERQRQLEQTVQEKEGEVSTLKTKLQAVEAELNKTSTNINEKKL